VQRGVDLHVLNRGRSRDRPLPPEARLIRGDVRDVTWHDEDPARQQVDPRMDAIMDRLIEAYSPRPV
jgi:hypothetical protein